jgi:hypothetical protein
MGLADVRDWTVRHERTLTVFGAFLIFCTFVMRDNKREEYKDLVSEINAAKTAFDVRNDFSYPTWLIMDTREKVNNLNKNTRTTPELPGPKRRKEIEHQLEAAGAQYFRYMNLFIQLETLNSHLRNSNKYAQEVSDHGDQCVDALLKKEEINKKFQSLKDHEDAQTLLSTELVGVTFDVLNQEAVALQQGATQQEDFYNSLTPKIMDEVEEEEKTSKKRFDLYSKLSFWVYGLGWMLALGAKLLGGINLEATP